jgi:hypothetical protein
MTSTILRRIPWPRLYFAGMALLFAALMAQGIWRYDSAVPQYDMWDAYLGFYTRAGQSWHAWVEQHNEHRLVLSRPLFWADLHFFHGSMTLLYVLNAVFPFLIVACLAFLLRRLQPPPGLPRNAEVALVAVLAVLATWWAQDENFIWAFQSQFWLVYLLPLVAFALLAHARAAGSRRSFWLACLTGFASAWTMANGTLALPLLAAQALWLRLRWRDAGALLLLAALTLALYRHGYHVANPAAGQGAWTDMASYVLLFLGGPWHFLLKPAHWWPAMLAGAVWIALAAFMAARVLRQRPAHPYAVALLMLLAYVGAAALGAAYNRIVMGVGQALAPRYLTPQLLSWAALLLLAVHLWPRALASRWALGGYALIPLLLLPVQLQSLKVPRDHLVARRLPALALQLDVRDMQTEAFQRMTYLGERTFALAGQAKREHLTVFGEPDMQLAARHWLGGGDPAPLPATRCAGAVQAVEPIAGAPNAVRVSGWVYDPARQQAPSLVLLTGAAQGRGAALGGLRRSGMAQPPSTRSERYSAFSGYLQTGALAGAVTLTGWIDQKPVCALTVELPPVGR